MKRVLISVGVIAAVGLPATLANARGVRAKLELRGTSAGKILVDASARGFTIYAFARDSRNKDACQNISHCLTAWPPVKTSGKPIAGPGVRQRLLGTITLKNGAKQVTYAGHPLYTFLGDSMPAETNFINFRQFGGRWPALNASGTEVTKK